MGVRIPQWSPIHNKEYIMEKENNIYPYHNMTKEVALAFAVDLLKQRSITPSEVLQYAHRFEKYLLGKDE
jgi:hypothetical protein